MTATTLTARPALSSELDTVLALCLEAFADEAVTAWLVPDPGARLAAMREMLGASLAAAVDAEALVVAFTREGEAVAASIWLDRGETPEDIEVPAGDAGLPPRLAAVRSLTAARHPTVPHIYLASMGTVPKRRGLGAGTAMLRYGLDRAHRLGLPVYLEASTPLNRKLYARHGFTDHGAALRLPEGGPLLQPMWHGA
ncbi:N-acetyltransferase [Micromonospora zingiberis]|uniref:N-acetyltransferase n=1 Tax=Micromonospora zingiberis TaxID=2053011 RepID=A0A4R0GLL9_9ACTN|nr:GNAT family N-acetyltransferase [Micromonospora zingiberis]TCB98380.1 N-acetyltransferase [Micromonospora zingiberis]